jgi:hypothetical protein
MEICLEFEHKNLPEKFLAEMDPILTNTIFPILHICVRFSYKYV